MHLYPNSTNMKSILIVEDEVIISEDIKMMLGKLGYSVVGAVYNGDKVSDAVVNKKPDLVLLDINIKGSKNGLEVAADLEKIKVPYAFITSYSDADTLSKAMTTKPTGYLVKPFNIDQLKVLVEMAFFNIERLERKNIPTIEEIETQFGKKVTKSEHSIIMDISDGLSYEQIAKKKFISINTVKSHIRHIYNKFDVGNKVELLNLLQ